MVFLRAGGYIFLKKSAVGSKKVFDISRISVKEYGCGSPNHSLAVQTAWVSLKIRAYIVELQNDKLHNFLLQEFCRVSLVNSCPGLVPVGVH